MDTYSQRHPPQAVDFDLFFQMLKAGKTINESDFYLEGDIEYDYCYLGFIPDLPSPYWFGLVPDGSQAYEFSTAEELVNAKVFHGHSLLEVWPLVRFYTLGGIDVSEWLSWYAK